MKLGITKMKREQTTKELHEKRAVLWNESISAHQKYIDEATGLFAEEYVEDRKCPACGAEKRSHLFNKEGGTYVKCDACNMVFLNPVFNDEALTDFYKNNHAIQAEVVESDMSFYTNLYNQGLDSIETIISKDEQSKILDIGCSSGVFLDTARQRGWQTLGVELNRQEAVFAKEKGHQVFTELLADIDFAEQFDAVTMWDVFEHIKDGALYLNMIKKHLAPGGVIFIQVPSSDALAARMLQEKCNMFDGMEHVNLYCLKAMEVLVKRCGLKIKKINTVISEIGVINNHLAYEDPYTGSIDNKENIMGLLDENVIHENLLGYKFQAVFGE